MLDDFEKKTKEIIFFLRSEIEHHSEYVYFI